jgi:hypothetical protein
VDHILDVISRLFFIETKTMPEMPREYTLRRKAPSDADFVALFEAIMRDRAIEYWKGNNGRFRPGRYLYPGDGWRYWPMTAKLAPRIEFSRHVNRNRVEEAQRLRELGLIR